MVEHGDTADSATARDLNGQQVGGDHYQRMVIQPWDVMRACMSREEWLGFLKGNIIKYVMRANAKGGTEDLRKALHYLQTLIAESPQK